MLQTDSGGHGVDVSMSYADTGSATDSSTGANIDWIIGRDLHNSVGTNVTSDNSTAATTTAGLSLIVTIESNSSAVNNVSGVIDAAQGASMTEFTTDYTTNTTWAKAVLGTGPSVNRTDVRSAENLVDAAASNATADTPAVLFNRVTWLG